MQRSVRLRPWQKLGLEHLAAAATPDFLAVATPGAGKTTFALTAAVADLTANPGRRLVVVAPTSHLRVQWATAAAALGLHLDPFWTARDGAAPADMHGVVVTYQQVAANPDALRVAAAGGFVIFDEIHHAGEDRAWGTALVAAFGGAARRLALSGTPFRSDTNPIPFLTYDGDEARPDFTYGYGDALRDGGVVRPVVFPSFNGEMEWTAPDGGRYHATFDDPLDIARSNQRLRTALSMGGEWLPTVLGAAHARLTDLRLDQPDAAGLVVAMDVEHARGIAGMLTARHGVPVTVATSDDPAASALIAAFASGTAPWIVAVRMVSEGVDVPRLRVGVFATNTTTELFFRQAVGRLVRWTRGVPRQRAYLYIPDDRRLRTWAAQIAEERRHSLRRREPDDAGEGVAEAAAAVAVGDDEQLSLFAAISAVALDGRDGAHGDEGPSAADEAPDDDSLVLALVTPPLPGSAAAGPADDRGDGAPRPRHEHKRTLRARNSEHARTLVLATGLSHAKINAELNKRAGIGTISDATVEQLERRLGHAERWLRRL